MHIDLLIIHSACITVTVLYNILVDLEWWTYRGRSVVDDLKRPTWVGGPGAGLQWRIYMVWHKK